MGNNDSSFTGISAQNISSSQGDFSLFHHQDLLTSPDSEKPWNQKKLVNKLNHLNFIDGFIYLILSDNNGKYFLAKAYPLPCVKDELNCHLTSSEVINNIPNYKFDFLMIDDGLTAVLAPIQLISSGNDIIKLSLPEHSNIKKLRKTRRYKCDDIDCRLTQNDLEVEGKLIDFTPMAMGLKLNSGQNLAEFALNNTFDLTLFKKGENLYTGACRCIRDGRNSSDGKIVLSTITTHIERFPKRKMRNPRQQITPSFVLRFRHPFFQKNIERDIKEISTAGFSILDSLLEEMLLPGMIIPEISIVHSGVFKIPCSAQVLYRREDKINNSLQLGLTFTDMDIKSYSILNHIIGAHIDSNARVSTEVDMDALWEFFFDTGFIYGEKYEHIYSCRDDFKNTYEKLYRGNPDIARHFIYEKNGKIYGHIALIHAYEPTWIIHHFSSLQYQTKVPALIILRELTHYTNGFYRLRSSRIQYAITYYQPENKIVDKIFGGFSKHLNDLKGSSVDTFSYFYFKKTSRKQTLPKELNLCEYIISDFNILNEFYSNISGGLMIDAIGFNQSSELLKNSFSSCALKRDYKIFCLKYKNTNIAYFILNKSNLGLNLSDLLNCIKIIIINDKIITPEVLFAAIQNLAFYYDENNIPLLIYPHNFMSSHGYDVKKYYNMWALRTNDIYLDKFTEYMNNKFRMKYGN